MGQPACFQHKGQQSHALRTYLQHQKAEAAEEISACLFKSGAARRQQVLCAIYGSFHGVFPGCVMKGGAAFTLHTQAYANTLPPDEKWRLQLLLGNLGVTDISDIDIACPRDAFADTRRAMVETVTNFATALDRDSSILGGIWPELVARLRAATSLRQGEHIVTSYHDGSLHPVPAGAAQIPCVGHIHASLLDFRGGEHVLGRIGVSLQNAKHGKFMAIPFCDLSAPLDEHAVDVTADPPALVMCTASGLGIALRPLKGLLEDLRRMIFAETLWRPWADPRPDTKVSKHLARAFVVALLLDGCRAPPNFTDAVDAFLDLCKKEQERGSAVRRQLAYLGMGGVSRLDLEDAARWNGGASCIESLMQSVLETCAAAPSNTQAGFGAYLTYMNRVSEVLSLLDMGYGEWPAIPTGPPTTLQGTEAPGIAAPPRSASTFLPSMKALALRLPLPLRVVESVVAVLWAMLADGNRRCMLCDDRAGLPARLADGAWTLHCPSCHAICLESLADA